VDVFKRARAKSCVGRAAGETFGYSMPNRRAVADASKPDFNAHRPASVFTEFYLV
jgi:hypothetical protein